jgi:hypothetical protein
MRDSKKFEEINLIEKFQETCINHYKESLKENGYNPIVECETKLLTNRGRKRSNLNIDSSNLDINMKLTNYRHFVRENKIKLTELTPIAKERKLQYDYFVKKYKKHISMTVNQTWYEISLEKLGMDNDIVINHLLYYALESALYQFNFIKSKSRYTLQPSLTMNIRSYKNSLINKLNNARKYKDEFPNINQYKDSIVIEKNIKTDTDIIHNWILKQDLKEFLKIKTLDLYNVFKYESNTNIPYNNFYKIVKSYRFKYEIKESIDINKFQTNDDFTNVDSCITDMFDGIQFTKDELYYINQLSLNKKIELNYYQIDKIKESIKLKISQKFSNGIIRGNKNDSILIFN